MTALVYFLTLLAKYFELSVQSPKATTQMLSTTQSVQQPKFATTQSMRPPKACNHPKRATTHNMLSIVLIQIDKVICAAGSSK